MHPHTLDAAVPIIISIFLLVIVVFLALAILTIVAKWKAFEKAGRKGWVSLIPFYNYAVMLELANEPLWWIALLFVPVANIVTAIIVLHRISRTFGHGGGFTAGLVFLPFVFWPILAFGTSKYENTFPPTPATSSATKWALAAAAFYAFIYFGMLTSLGNSHSIDLQPLTVIKSDGSDGNTYATDGRYVYANDQVVPGADPQSFKLHGSYASDWNHEYYAAVPIDEADVTSFRVLAGDYAIDSHAVYYAGKLLPDADVRSFRALDEEYAIDDRNAYYYGDTITGADSASFTILGSPYAKDRTAVYYSGAPIAGADPATFALEEDPSGNYTYDARDKNHLYQAGEIVTKGKTSSVIQQSGN